MTTTTINGQTRKTLAMRVIDPGGPAEAALLHDAMAEIFDQAELVAADYGTQAKVGTPRTLARSTAQDL